MPPYMEIQTAPLPRDVEYFLDAALEHDELDAGSHVALKLYAPRIELMRVVDDDWELGPGTIIKRRLARCTALADMASSILDNISLEARGAIAHAGVQHMRGQIKSLSWCLATWAIEDEIHGGCLVPHKRSLSRKAWRYEMSPKQRRHLYAPAFIRRYVKGNDSAQQLRQMGSLAIRRATPIPKALVADAANLLSQQLQAQHEGYRRFNARAIRQMAERSVVSVNANTRVIKQHARRQRKIIKRAAACAASVIGATALTAFASGKPVTIEGQSLHLEVSRLGSSAGTGHGALAICAIDPLTSRRLADLCVYHEKTPALDQLTPLALAMQSGEEAEIVATANLSRVTDLGIEHPLIAERGKSHLERWTPRDDKARKNEAYFTETKPMWVEALGVFVLGRMWERNAS